MRPLPVENKKFALAEITRHRDNSGKASRRVISGSVPVRPLTKAVPSRDQERNYPSTGAAAVRCESACKRSLHDQVGRGS